MSNIYSSSITTTWFELELQEKVRLLQRQLETQERELMFEIRKLQDAVDRAEDFVRYVDETAPELRTAYNVSKRIE